MFRHNWANIVLPDRTFTCHFHLLPPANEVCQGYVFTPVCQSFCSQAGVPGQVHPQAGTPPGQVHPPFRYPWAGTPPGAVHAERYRQQAGGTHPIGMHSCFDLVLILMTRSGCLCLFTPIFGATGRTLQMIIYPYVGAISVVSNR